VPLLLLVVVVAVTCCHVTGCSVVVDVGAATLLPARACIHSAIMFYSVLTENVAGTCVCICKLYYQKVVQFITCTCTSGSSCSSGRSGRRRLLSIGRRWSGSTTCERACIQWSIWCVNVDCMFK